MADVTASTVIELHELCLDICPFSMSDRDAVCPGCPLYKHAVDRQWRFAFGDAVKLIKAWATYAGKQVR